MEQGLAQRPVIVRVSHNLRGDSWGYVPRSLFWWEDLDRDGERGFDHLTFALVSSKAHREGVGLRVADSHVGNHPEGGFTPSETIRRLLVVIGRSSHSGFEGETFEPERSETHLPQVMSAKDTIAVQRCGLSAKELNEFISSYLIPSEYDVILPKSTQTIFDAPPGYVGLYTHSFSLDNPMLPLTDFFCEVLQYFKVHISRLNPFGCAKLTTFIIMCKAYGCEPSVDLFRGFFNLCQAGSWLTFQKRSEKHIPDLLPKVITRIEGWHERFFFVKDSIISSKYPQLLLDENKLDSKSFKDKLPPNIEENMYFQRLGQYPTSVRMFDDLILFLAGLKPSWEFSQQWPAIIVGGKEMAFRNFIYTEDDDDLAFLPKEPSLRFGIGSPSASVNTKPPKYVEEPEVQPAEVTTDSGESPKTGVFVVHPGSVAARIREMKCKTRRGFLKPTVKRKLASESSSSCVVRAKNSASKDDAPFLSIFDDDERLPDCFELKDASACHLKISAITPPAWKVHLDNQMDLELLDLHDRSTMSEFHQNLVVLALRKKISSLAADVKEHKEADKARLEAVETSLRREIEVIPYAAMELVHSDELGSLVGKLVSSAITYGHCRAYKQVATMKEPFDLSKVKGYRSSYQKEHTHASNDFVTATFPWLDEFVADAAALIEALLSKKPPTLLKPAPLRTQMPMPSSQKATPSSAPSINPISPPANLLKLSPTLPE
ncbi:hypothetical protein Tco_0386020 [Tanacetum coccineum]